MNDSIPETRFKFGENWQSYVDNVIDEKRINQAVHSLKQMLKIEDLQGQTFLDIGCGSGIFSLAAVLLGAECVFSFDYDPDSVQATLTLCKRMNINNGNWQIMQGSVLDDAFLDKLDSFDVVYSWGVLHHTGSMWQAIDNSYKKVKPNGLFAIAIYNDVNKIVGGSVMWKRIKHFYTRSPKFVKRIIELIYVGEIFLKHFLTLRNPLNKIKHYGEGGQGRGMDFFHDVRDWLGGYPYEYASAGKIFEYLHNKFGAQLEYLSTRDGHICNEFTFRV